MAFAIAVGGVQTRAISSSRSSLVRAQERCHGFSARNSRMCATNQAQTPPEGKMGISFTCNKCDTRISKMINQRSYTKGVVIVECPTCKSRHLIADNLGWYKDWTGGSQMGTVGEFVGKQGERVIRIDPSSLVMTEESTGEAS